MLPVPDLEQEIAAVNHDLTDRILGRITKAHLEHLPIHGASGRPAVRSPDAVGQMSRTPDVGGKSFYSAGPDLLVDSHETRHGGGGEHRQHGYDYQQFRESKGSL